MDSYICTYVFPTLSKSYLFRQHDICFWGRLYLVQCLSVLAGRKATIWCLTKCGCILPLLLTRCQFLTNYPVSLYLTFCFSAVQMIVPSSQDCHENVMPSKECTWMIQSSTWLNKWTLSFSIVRFPLPFLDQNPASHWLGEEIIWITTEIYMWI